MADALAAPDRPGARLASLSRFPSHAGSDRAFDVPHERIATPPRARAASTPRIDRNEAIDRGHARSFCVISGGTGANALVDAFTSLGPTVFVLPVSDNGGSSSELIRVMGGPSLGDIRSRLVRLIPPAPPDSPEAAIKALLEHRLPSGGTDPELRAIWSAIVEGKSQLWRGIPPDRREVLRSFLSYWEAERLKRASKRYQFRSASVGNILLSGALLFTRSIESAIFLLSSITQVPSATTVVPCIHTNSVVTIAAELADGSRLVGQMAISHPAPPAVESASAVFEGPQGMMMGDDDALGHGEIDRPFGDEAPTQIGNIAFEKVAPPLPARIKRILYINSYGQQVFPKANDSFLRALHTSSCLVYSCGSLYTSVVPVLGLHGVGRSIVQSPSLRYKVLLLNSTPDREAPADFTAVDYVTAIRRCLNEPGGEPEQSVHMVSDYITHLVCLRDGLVELDRPKLELLGIRIVEVDSATPLRFDSSAVQHALEAILAGQA